MATATIHLSDDGGEISVHAEFDPPLMKGDSEDSYAHLLAINMLQLAQSGDWDDEEE